MIISLINFELARNIEKCARLLQNYRNMNHMEVVCECLGERQ